MNELTGTIKNASWDPTFNVIWGFIYGDTKGRFKDGTYIHTSLISGYSKKDRPKEVETLNSRYEIEWK